MCQAEFVFRQNWNLTIKTWLRKSQLTFSSQNWLLQNRCAFTAVKHNLSLAEEVAELASVLKQNQPFILEVVELASVLKQNQPSILEVVEFATAL